jgi:hypothetical protein
MIVTFRLKLVSLLPSSTTHTIQETAFSINSMTKSAALFAYFCALIAATPRQASAAPVTIQLSASHDGISSLSYEGGQYLSSPYSNAPKGSFHVATKFAGDTNVTDNSPASVALSGNTLTNRYSWGIASCTYTAANDQITFAYTIKNTSGRTLDVNKLHVLDIAFPSLEVPKSWSSSYVPGVFNNQQPQVLMAAYNTGTLAVVQPDTARAANFEIYFSYRYYNGYPLNLVSFNPIAPGASDQFQVQIRFGAPGTWKADLASDVLSAFQRANPQLNSWSDRRPIGQDFLAAAVDKKWPTNPRGWLNDKTINVFTSAGLATFKTKMFQHVDWLIKLAKQMNAQGIIFWDLEGEQYPQGVSTYVGDPRLLGTLAPEMDAAADQLLSSLTTQGLRVGLTIRAQQIVFRRDGSFYQKDWPVGNDDAVFDDLDSKINYAITRWGASIFYIDSNSWPNDYYQDASVFQRLQQKYPNVLICPEFHTLKYYTCVTPYLEMRRGYFGTFRSDYEVFPGAFSLVNAADGNMTQRSQIAQSIARGDIILYRAWYPNNEYFAIQSLYKQVTSSPKPIAFPNDYQATAGAPNVYNATSNGFVLGAPNGTLKILSTTSPQHGGTATVQNNKLVYTAPSTPGISDSVTITVSDGNSVTITPIGLHP